MVVVNWIAEIRVDAIGTDDLDLADLRSTDVKIRTRTIRILALESPQTQSSPTQIWIVTDCYNC